MSEPGKRVLVLTGADERAWNTSWRDGERPSAYPYGIEKLAPFVDELAFAPRVRRGAAATKARDVLEHRLGYPVERAARAIRQARRSDVVIAMLEPYATLPGRLKRLPGSGYSRSKLMALTCWAGEEIRTGDSETRRRVVEQLNRIDEVIVFSSNQVSLMEDAGVSPQRITVIPYGVDAEFYTPDSATVRDIDVVSVGQDHGRDYRTLAEAVSNIDASVEVVAKPANLVDLDFSSNVKIREPITHMEYRALLRRAKVVALATHELAYPTGQSVALEAAAAGTPVVVTGTVPMQEYFVDGRDALLARPGDARDLAGRIEEALEDPSSAAKRALNARERVIADFSTEAMWTRIGALVDR